VKGRTLCMGGRCERDASGDHREMRQDCTERTHSLLRCRKRLDR
jgi:hypothetical protein